MPRIAYLFSIMLGYSNLILLNYVLYPNNKTLRHCHIHAFEVPGGILIDIPYIRGEVGGKRKRRLR